MKPEKREKKVEQTELNEGFKEDYSEKNPGLHLLYVKWAVKHLYEVNKMIIRLDQFHNVNMVDFVLAIIKEKEKIIKSNKAYFDANEIIESIGLGLEKGGE